MPRYKVIAPGFFNGKTYNPNGKRRVLHTDKPFPKSTKGVKKGETAQEMVPSWLKRLPDESLADEQKRKDAEAAAALAAKEKAENDRKDIGDASFMGEGEKADFGDVETL
jgi:hypothetical protein